MTIKLSRKKYLLKYTIVLLSLFSPCSGMLLIFNAKYVVMMAIMIRKMYVKLSLKKTGRKPVV
ncbi:hypothetical protein A3K73_05820 [Candidatus Pacearchaeota archaeon RBG_13_36_9]|nr:MAG: hypothetical protein A3K73_05820 [Candidatus Pacearchaeota archaeon RBG_13_36_9]